MIQSGASDFHFCTAVRPILRLDGDIVPIDGAEESKDEDILRMLEEIMPEKNRVEFADCNDTDWAYEIAGLARFRFNAFRDHQGCGAVARQIPANILTADQLGLPKAVRDLCWLTKGLVVVTGPTGSGKSTTLAAMIDLINDSRDDHLITIEDPVEFVHKNKRCLINHREVHKHTMSFKRALRAALRQDPDIILVGEMRDLETVEIAIETAETGHLVFGTLHTTTAMSTVDRIIDQFSADRQSQVRTMLASSLKGVVAQVLCKKIGGGRCAALEILIVTSAISNLIREQKMHQIPSLMQVGHKFGMQLLNDALMELVQGGKVEPMEAFMKAVDKEGIKTKLETAGYPLGMGGS
jgi:twitching motility protein PilT